MTRRLVDEAGAAEYLGTTERHVRELRYRRALPFVKVGRLVRLDLAALDRWIEANTVDVWADEHSSARRATTDGRRPPRGTATSPTERGDSSESPSRAPAVRAGDGTFPTLRAVLDEDEAERLYGLGLTLVEVGARVGVGATTVRRRLLARGVTMRLEGRRRSDDLPHRGEAG